MEEKTYRIDFALRFDDRGMIAEEFRKKLKRSPTEDDWQEVFKGEEEAEKHYIDILKEQFGVIAVNEEDTHLDYDFNKAGTCLVSERLGMELLAESDHSGDGNDYLYENSDLSKPGPSSEAAWNALHECDGMTVAFDNFPDELVDEYERSAK